MSTCVNCGQPIRPTRAGEGMDITPTHEGGNPYCELQWQDSSGEWHEPYAESDDLPHEYLPGFR